MAKEETQRDERTIVAYAGADAADRFDQSPNGSLVGCTAGKQWAGQTTMTLREGARAAEVLKTISRAASADGWHPEDDVNILGDPRLTLRSDEGVALLISPRDDGTTLQVSSFSRCIPLPDDLVPEYSY